jgi:hypothetical protein
MYHKRFLDAQIAQPTPMPEGGRSQRPKSGSRPPQGMGIASAVSPPGPQRIIAQMLRASGIQTDRSQHYVVATVLQYEYYGRWTL